MATFICALKQKSQNLNKARYYSSTIELGHLINRANFMPIYPEVLEFLCNEKRKPT